MSLSQSRITFKESRLKLRRWHIARSVLSNWFATAASLAVGFFLAHFLQILPRLKSDLYANAKWAARRDAIRSAITSFTDLGFQFQRTPR
jgi:hypothetical protein